MSSSRPVAYPCRSLPPSPSHTIYSQAVRHLSHRLHRATDRCTLLYNSGTPVWNRRGLLEAIRFIVGFSSKLRWDLRYLPLEGRPSVRPNPNVFVPRELPAHSHLTMEIIISRERDEEREREREIPVTRRMNPPCRENLPSCERNFFEGGSLRFLRFFRFFLHHDPLVGVVPPLPAWNYGTKRPARLFREECTVYLRVSFADLLFVSLCSFSVATG